MSYNNPVVILGKSYKPNVSFTDGSYSILVDYFVKKEGCECYYDEEPNRNQPYTYLLGHRYKFYDHNFVDGSIIVDPWGDCPQILNTTIKRYGRI